MSAWEGSEWQIQQEKAKAAREAEVDKIQRENPWLARQDCEEWQRQLEEARARAAVKCCPCHGRAPGVVRRELGPRGLGPCRCSCHEKRVR